MPEKSGGCLFTNGNRFAGVSSQRVGGGTDRRRQAAHARNRGTYGEDHSGDYPSKRPRMISVVVCTYNRAHLLRRMLSAFVEQEGLTYSDYELLIIDNNSKDRTSYVAECFKMDGRMRYIFEGRQGLSIARNRGIAEARGEIVAFLDDDVIVSPQWLLRMRECFDTTEADVVGGKTYLVFDEPPPPWLGPAFRMMLSEVDLGATRRFVDEHEAGLLFGANLSFRKRSLLTIGGFDETLGRCGESLLGGEETAAVAAIIAARGKVVYDPHASDRKSTRLNSSHRVLSRMPSSA